MKRYLLDINVLIALFWPAHEQHEKAQSWFRDRGSSGWATCPLTQNGFIRITSNPRFSRDAVSTREANARLAANLSSRQHRFLPASISYVDAVAPFLERLQLHSQVADAYLLGLAIHHQATLATFDIGMSALAPENSAIKGALEILALKRQR